MLRTAALAAEIGVARAPVARVSLLPGGAGANVAAGLASEGLAVTMVGCVGADGGAAPAAALRGRGVRLALRTVPAASTGTVVVLVGVDGERSMASDRGTRPWGSCAGRAPSV